MVIVSIFRPYVLYPGKGHKLKSEKKQLVQIEKARPTLPGYGKYQ
jgi:hypothetical protein